MNTLAHISFRRVAAQVLHVLSVFALGLLLTGCGQSNATASKKGEARLEIWQAFNTEETVVFRKLMNEFKTEWEKKNGRTLNLDLQYVSYNDMFTKLRTAALAHKTPDVAFVDSIKVTDLALGRALVRIDQLPAFKKDYGTIDKAEQEFVKASFQSGVVNRLGTVGLYALPVQTTCVALFWNRAMFREKAGALRKAGLDPGRTPRDWDELVRYGKVLTDKNQGVYAYGMYNSLWFNFPFFNMYDVQFIRYRPDGTAESALNSDRGRAALARIQSIANSGVEGGAWKRSALGPDAGFLNRKYAMILTGPWNVQSFTNAGLDFDIALIPGPTKEEVEKLGLTRTDSREHPEPGQLAYTSSNVGGQSGVILRACPNPGLAFEALQYFTSERVQRQWASELGQIPVRLSAWKNLDTSKYPYMPKFMEQLQTAKRVPQIPLYGVLESDIFNPQIDLLLQNRQTPQEMLTKMDAAMKAQILSRINEKPE